MFSKKYFLRSLKKVIIVAFTFVLALMPASAHANSRIKDIASFEGVRENLLVGYGLVVGLSGTGDNISSIVFTKESLIGMLERLGINTRNGQLQSKNVAAVMVTASLPPFARQGSTIDVTVSALGDAKSLLGGTLMVTPLVGADGEVYAVAQGQLAVGGFSAQGNAQTVTKGVPTSGRIVNGAIIEREIPFAMDNMENMKISLRNPDFTTATRVSKAINSFLGTTSSRALDPATISLEIPADYRSNVVGLITEIEQLRVAPDQLAKVIIDEQSGIIVIGENVRINEVAIAQGNLTIRVTETPQVSQPSPFAQTGETTVVPRTEIEIDEQAENKFGIVKTGVNLQELVDGLNALGIGPRDMIGILQAIKASGSLQADIEVM